MKKLTYAALLNECEPEYHVEFHEAGNIVKHHRKFHNPLHVRDFIGTLPKECTYTIYKKI